MSWLWLAALVVAIDALMASRFARCSSMRSLRAGRLPNKGASDTLDILALGLRRGLSFRDVVALGAHHSISSASDLAGLVQMLDRGVEAQDAVRQSSVAPQTSLGVVLVALASSLNSGLRLDAELDRVRADVQQLDTNATAAAARRMSVWQTGPLVLCHLPAFVIVAIVPTVVPIFSSATF